MPPDLAPKDQLLRFIAPETSRNGTMSSVAAPALVPAARPAPRHVPPAARPISRILLALPFLPILFLALMPTAYNHLRAASILMAIAEMPESAMSNFDTNPVIVEEIAYPSMITERARIYHPVGIAHPSAVVVVPGVHYLGMNEPRLRRFAQALASHGYLVLTPRVDELADYNITKSSAAVIGDAVHELARRSGAPKVGLLGLSFAGGMSLIAASDDAVQKQLTAVVAIGAH